MKRVWMGAGLVIGFLLAPSGCSDLNSEGGSRTPTSRWNRINLPNTPPDAAFDAGVAALRQYFPTVATSRTEGRIDTPMVEYSQRGGTERIRDAAVNHNNRMRRKATLIITPSGDGCFAICEVRVQRMDTADQRAFQQHREFSDVPNQTPIQRDAGVSGEQSESWTEMPRDAKLERDILQIVFNRVNARDEAGAVPGARSDTPKSQSAILDDEGAPLCARVVTGEDAGWDLSISPAMAAA